MDEERNPFEESDFEFALEKHRQVRKARMRERDWERQEAHDRAADKDTAVEAENKRARVSSAAHRDDDAPSVESEWDRERNRREQGWG